MADPNEFSDDLGRMLDALMDRGQMAYFGRSGVVLDGTWTIDEFRAAIAALTPQPSAEDAAVLDDIALRREFIDDQLARGFPDRDPKLILYGVSEFLAKLPDCLARMAGKVPTGYVLVPETPTADMIRAWFSTAHHHEGQTFEAKYKAMLAAAPEAPR